jgi:putative membrane protein
MTWIRAAFLDLSPIARTLIIVWALAMMLLPLVRRRWGERALPRGVTANVLLQAMMVLAILWPAWGPARTLLTTLAVLVLGWGVEFLGSSTGIPFGRYHYTDRLQPQLAHVPLVIPVAWLMMLPPAWGIAAAIAGEVRGLAFVVLSGLAITAWDFFLDPQMVGWRLWVWERRGGYFGIPWVNFAGWALAASLITVIVQPTTVPVAPLMLVYAATWALETVGQIVFWRLYGPALAGFAAMGTLLVWAWL